MMVDADSGRWGMVQTIVKYTLKWRCAELEGIMARVDTRECIFPKKCVVWYWY